MGAPGKIAALVRGGLVDPHSGQTYPLVQAAQTLAAIESGHGAGELASIP